jgi:hypothetical protein
MNKNHRWKRDDERTFLVEPQVVSDWPIKSRSAITTRLSRVFADSISLDWDETGCFPLLCSVNAIVRQSCFFAARSLPWWLPAHLRTNFYKYHAGRHPTCLLCFCYWYGQVQTWMIRDSIFRFHFSLLVDKQVISKISNGLMVLVGIGSGQRYESTS